jgi:UDP-glucose 4-epimerase
MILITGGMGFIGLHTARSLIDRGEKVVLTRYRVSREPEFIKPELGRSAFVEALDVTDGNRLLEIAQSHGVTGIIHLASPGLGALDAAGDFRVNMNSLLNVLETARICQVRRLCVASSVAVYTGVAEGPFKEEASLRLAPSYAIEAYKKAYEVLATHYAQRTDIDVVLLRIGSIWGPLYHSMGNAMSRLVHGAVRGEPPLMREEIFEDDAQDYCYVRDCGEAISLLQMAPKLNHQAYNIGGGRATSNGEIVDAIRRHFPEAMLPLTPGGSLHRKDPYMDLARIKHDVGFEPKYDLDSAMTDYIAWLRSNPE